MHDFLAIGDTVTDAFIRLKDAKVHCDVNGEHCTITMAFGDKIPYESVEVVRAVGNSANAAVSAARLGLSSALVTNIGEDEEGAKTLEHLKNDGVSTEYITVHKDKKTNYHYVLWYDNDRTILIKHEEYDYKLPELKEPKWLYLSSLGAGTLDYQKTVVEWLAAHPEVKLAFQPGTFQIKLGKDKLADVYKRAEIFFCNVEEAEKILDAAGIGVPELLKRMRALGPEIVVITDGSKGAYAFDGKRALFLPVYPTNDPPYERTGAGDAFASTAVVALALGKDLTTALVWGAVNSMSVVSKVGAQKGLLSREELEVYVAKAPDFKATELKI
ncbi:MAG: carbohydrate kinase family protein [Minisyncoccia bacterium]